MTFCKVSCPIIPFITEEIYQNLKTNTDPESIHLCDFPVYCANHRDYGLEKMMSLTVKAITMGRALRSSNSIKNRQPLKKLFLVDRNDEDRAILNSMNAIIAEELNVKEVEIQSDESALVDYKAKANFKILGSKLGKSMKEVASKIQEFNSEHISKMLEGIKTKIEYGDNESIEVSSEDLIIQRDEKANLKIINDGSLTVGFDTEVTQDLLFEGIARDIVRSIQTLRKESGLEVSDRIKLKISGDEEVRTVCEKFADYIKNETLTSDMTYSDNLDVPENEAGLKLIIEKV